MTPLSCPKCGEPTERLHEGYCLECCDQAQSELLQHNYEYDRWQKLTDKQRWDEITGAM